MRAIFSYLCCHHEKQFMFSSFTLFQHLHSPSPLVFLVYKMGAILLKKTRIKTQDFLFNFPPSSFIPSASLLSSFQLFFMNDLQISSPTKKPQYIFNYKGKLRLLTSCGKEVDPGTKYFLKKRGKDLET